MAKHADQISVKHNSNHHNSEKFDRCDLLLDFGQLDDATARRILNGQNYKLTISAISDMHVVSETVTLFSYKHPEIKYFSVSFHFSCTQYRPCWKKICTMCYWPGPEAVKNFIFNSNEHAISHVHKC